MTFEELVKRAQRAMNAHGEKLTVDGDPGPKTRAALAKYDITLSAIKAAQPVPSTPPASSKKKTPPWYTFALRFKGKKETDPTFNRDMSKKWSLFGMNLGTIATSWAAWCGLAMAVALSGVGVDYAKNGALARNWPKYGVEVSWRTDGVPQGAIVHINNAGVCSSSSSNHVAQANGDCSAADLLKPGGTIALYGGNQGNTWKVSVYAASKICAVRWPKDVKDYPKPGPISKSVNCTGTSTDSNESTR